MSKIDDILLVGNPNVGKSLIFNYITGNYAQVSNYPGTSVEVTSANFSYQDQVYNLIDTPGINSLASLSEDEIATRAILLERRPANVVQITDAKNLRRSLFITIQLIECGLPMLMDLNMYDEAIARGVEIDITALKNELGIEVLTSVATEGRGLKKLKSSLTRGQMPNNISVDYGPELEKVISEISQLLPDSHIAARARALMLLGGEQSLLASMNPAISQAVIEITNRCQRSFYEPLNLLISKKRQVFVSQLTSKVFRIAPDHRDSDLLRQLGSMLMTSHYGLISAIVAMYSMYYFVGVFGAGTCVDFLETVVFGQYLLPPVQALVDRIAWEPGRDFLMGDYGIISMGITYAVAIVLPIVITFFSAFGLFEDSGYLPRLTILTNRMFKRIGINGKAILPLVLGFGCVTMATMTTRILDSRRERIIASLLLALAIPCSAQLGVVIGILGSISGFALLLYWLIILSQLAFVGYLAGKFIPGKSSDFLMEIPPLRIPSLKNIYTKTFMRTKWFLKEAVPLFIYGTIALFFLDRSGLLLYAQEAAKPLVSGYLGLPEATSKAFIMGFFRRDYGAIGFLEMARAGLMDNIAILVSMVVITFFVPCVANVFVLIKEFGGRVTTAIVTAVFCYAIFIGGVINFLLRSLNVQL